MTVIRLSSVVISCHCFLTYRLQLCAVRPSPKWLSDFRRFQLDSETNPLVMAQNPVTFKEYCYSAVIVILASHFTVFSVLLTIQVNSSRHIGSSSSSHYFSLTCPITPRAHQLTLVSTLPSPLKPINSDWVRVWVGSSYS